MGGQGAVCVVLRVKSRSGGRALGCELFVGDARWELGLKLSVGQEVVMGWELSVGQWGCLWGCDVAAAVPAGAGRCWGRRRARAR